MSSSVRRDAYAGSKSFRRESPLDLGKNNNISTETKISALFKFEAVTPSDPIFYELPKRITRQSFKEGIELLHTSKIYPSAAIITALLRSKNGNKEDWELKKILYNPKTSTSQNIVAFIEEAAKNKDFSFILDGLNNVNRAMLTSYVYNAYIRSLSDEPKYFTPVLEAYKNAVRDNQANSYVITSFIVAAEKVEEYLLVDEAFSKAKELNEDSIQVYTAYMHVAFQMKNLEKVKSIYQEIESKKFKLDEKVYTLYLTTIGTFESYDSALRIAEDVNKRFPNNTWVLRELFQLARLHNRTADSDAIKTLAAQNGINLLQ